MNKKLFSWKALAGLALLVAMGMTSCKNTTEVDPNDPYNTQKPTKPSSSLDGDYDWEVTIAKTSDFADQWKSVADKVKKAVAEADGIDIKINCGAYALDGKTLTIPEIWKSAEGKIVNIVFSGSFKSKTDADGNELALDVNTDNLAGAEVNIYLPADEFKMQLAATKVKPTLAAESTATVTELTAKASGVKKSALTIADGVTVKGIDMIGALAGTDNVEALLVSSNFELDGDGKGAKVGSEDVFVKNLIITKSATVSKADKSAISQITVNENVKLTLSGAKPKVTTIVGLGTTKKPSTVVLAGDKDDLTNVESISNVTLENGVATNVKDFSIFESVIFNMDVNLYDDAANTEFNKAVNVKIEDGVENFTFANVNFGKNAELTMSGGTTTTGKKKLIYMYQYNTSTNKYVLVKDNDEDNLTAKNAKGDYKKYISSDYALKADLTKAIDDSLTLDTKFHFATIETAQTNLDAAKKAYAAEEVKSGVDGAKSKPAYTAYKTAWEVLYGTAKEDANYSKAGKSPDFKQVATADVYKSGATGAALNTALGLYRQYSNLWAFVTNANNAIADADWFEIYFATTDTVLPEDIDLIFDEDCTLGGKDLDEDKLNALINTDDFNKANEPWFNVTYGTTTYTWKLTKSTAELVEE